MRLERLWRVGLLAVLGGCVAGSEGPHGPGGPSQPEPGLRADLFAGPIEAPRQISIDAILGVTIGVRNRGTREADPGWIVRVVLSKDGLIDPADIEIDHFVAHRVLPAGAEDQYLRHMKLRGSIPLGEYYVGSILDVTSAVAESSEGNNVLQVPVPILLTATVPDSPARN